MFYRCFFLFFFRSPQKYQTTILGKAERIFMKLLPNDSGENGVCIAMPKWGLGPRLIFGGLKTTHCALWHFYWAPMKNKGSLLLRPPVLNAKSSKNFLSPNQNWANFWGLGVTGYKKFWFLLQKAHLFVNPRHLSHFAWKSVAASDPQACSGKKVRKSQRLP